jgi:NHLM bacteriocin system secretion protein
LSNYNTANSELKSIESEIQTLETKISLGEKSIEIQEESLEAQFDAAKSAIIDSLNLEIANYNTVIENNQITATVDGTVYTTFVTNGSSVSVDTEVLRINEGQEDNTLQAVYFLSLDSGKVVKEGMKINVYVNTLQKEEYGHMTGTVVSVADYVTSQADLYTRLGDSTLTSTFTSSGAVVEVVCELEKDSDTTSGFEWSSNKGKTVELTEGMLLEGSVIVEDVAPITLLIPKLKEKFSLE